MAHPTSLLHLPTTLFVSVIFAVIASSYSRKHNHDRKRPDKPTLSTAGSSSSISSDSESDDYEHVSHGSASNPVTPSKRYHNNPSNKVHEYVDTLAAPAIYESQIVKIVGKMFPKFRRVKDLGKRITVEAMSGGLSNLLFKVTVDGECDVKGGGGTQRLLHLLVRVDSAVPETNEKDAASRFNDSTADGAADKKVRKMSFDEENVAKHKIELVDKEVEYRIFTMLSKAGIAPKFYGRFLNGRIEEFYSDSRPIKFSEMGASAPQCLSPDVRSGGYAWGIATSMAGLHSLSVPSGVCGTDRGDPPQILRQMAEWHGLAEGVDLAAFNEGQTDPTKKLRTSNIQDEWVWLRDTVLFPPPGPRNPNVGVKFSRDNVFTHLDCQSLNIMTSPLWGSDEIRLIDFEYAGFNPRGLDIANTWLEHCDMNNLRPDYAGSFPSVGQQRFFLRRYCQECKVEEDLLNTNHFLEDLRRECLKFTLLSHLNWALWSIIQHDNSEIKFDFLEYAAIRMQGYHEQKIGLNFDGVIE